MKTKIEDLEQRINDDSVSNLELFEALFNKIQVIEDQNRRQMELIIGLTDELETQGQYIDDISKFLMEAPEIKDRRKLLKIVNQRKPSPTKFIEGFTDEQMKLFASDKDGLMEYARLHGLKGGSCYNAYLARVDLERKSSHRKS